MVLKAFTRTFFPASRPYAGVAKASAAVSGGMSSREQADIVRAAKELRSMNIDPQDPMAQQDGDIEPAGLSAIEARAIARMAAIAPFINNRVEQFGQAGERRLTESSLGYELVHRDPEKTLSDKQRKIADTIYDMLERGRSMSEKMRLMGRDSMEMDRGVGEWVPDQGGRPYLWDVWDGSTMRWATPSQAQVDAGRYNPLDRAVMQYQDGVPKRVIPRKNAIVVIRRPVTDIWRMGYGYPEVEQGADDIHRMLQADFRNGSFFDNGFNADFILKMRMRLGEDETEAFMDQLREKMRGVKNSHGFAALMLSPRLGNMQPEEDIEKLDLSPNAKDMEYRFLLTYYYRRVASLFQTDLEEIGMGDPADTGKASLSEADSSWKIAMSREKGLRTALNVVALELTRQLVWPFDRDIKLVFNGLNALSPEKQVALDTAKMATMTLNEFRKYKNQKTIKIEGQDWPDSVVLNPSCVQLYMGSMAQAQQAPQAPGAAPQGDGQSRSPEGQEPPDVGPEGEDYGPQDEQGQAGPTDNEADQA